MPASDLQVITRIGVKRKPRRILSIVSNTAQLKGFAVGFFGEEMTRAFLMFTQAGHRVDLASPKGGEVMLDTHSDPRTPDGAYADDLISLGFVHHAKFGPMLEQTLPIAAVRVDDYDAVWVAGGGGPLLTFKDDAEALQIANSTVYGLGSGLWTSNLQRAHRFARELRAGMVWINSYKRVNPGSPFGGVGESGYGREMGFDAMREYTQVKSVWVNVDAQIPPWYPR